MIKKTEIQAEKKLPYNKHHSFVYDFFVPERKQEALFWVKHIKPFGNKILDLMCGTGEIAYELAQKDLEVTCIDSSRDMLNIAKSRQSKLGQKIKNMKLLEADALDINLSEKNFDFVLLTGNSINHFLQDNQIKRLFDIIRKHTKNLSGLGIEYTNPLLLKDEIIWTKVMPIRNIPQGLKAVKIHKYNYSKTSRILDNQINFEITVGLDKFVNPFDIKLRFYSEDEIKKILTENGFGNINFFGGFSEESLTHSSGNIITLSTKNV